MNGKGEKYFIEGFLSVILEDMNISSRKTRIFKDAFFVFWKDKDGGRKEEVEKRKKEYGKEK